MRRLLVLSCAIVFLDIAFFAAVTPLLPHFKDSLGLGDSAIGLLSATYAAGTLVFSIPAGMIAARLGPRRTVMAGVLAMGLSSLGFGLAGSILSLDLFRLLQGASGALMWSGAFAWLIATAPDGRRGQVIGTAMAAAVFGQLLGAPIGALALEVGTEAAYGAMLPVALALVLFALTIPDADGAEVARQSPGEALARARRAPVPRVALLIAVPSVVFGAVLVLVPLRLDEMGSGAGTIAAAFAAAAVVEGGLAPFAGRLSDRAGRVRPYVAGLSMSAITLLVIGIGGATWMVFAAVVFVAIGAGLMFTPATAMLSEAASSAGLHQGYTAAISNMAWGAGQAVGGFGAGALASLMGSIAPSVAISVLALLAARTIRRGATTFSAPIPIARPADAARPSVAP